MKKVDLRKHRPAPFPDWLKQATEMFRQAPWLVWMDVHRDTVEKMTSWWINEVRRRYKKPKMPLAEVFRTPDYAKSVNYQAGGVPRDLNPAQMRAVDALNSSREVWFQAANRLGKSQIGGIVASWYAHGIDPFDMGIPEAPNLVWCGVPDYHNHATSVSIPILRYFLGKPGVKWKRGTYTFEVCSHASQGNPCANGKCPDPSRIVLKSYDSGSDKWQGAAPALVWGDETMPRDVYDEVSIRISIGEPLKIFNTLTPLREAGWVKADLYDRWVDDGKPKNKAFVEGNMWENVHLPLEEIEQTREKYKHDSDQLKARLYGMWSMTPGVVFPMLDGDIHLVEDFEIPGVHRFPKENERPWTLYRAVDPGIRNPTAIMWAAVAPSGLCYIYREDEIKDKSIPEVCSEVGMAETAHERANGFQYTVIDPAAAQRDLVDASRRIDAYARHGLICLPGNNDRVYGIDKLKQAFAWEKDEAGEWRRDPKYRIFRSCFRTWDELRRYSWLPYKDSQVRGPRDDAQKKDDHLVDCLRYLEATFVGPVFGRQTQPVETFEPSDHKTGY